MKTTLYLHDQIFILYYVINSEVNKRIFESDIICSWDSWLLAIENICIIVGKYNCTSFRNRKKSELEASFSGLLFSEYKWILYLTTMYIYCVYPAMSKNPKQQPNCLKRAETDIILIVLMVSSVTSAPKLLLFLTVTQHESGTRKTISWSVTVYNKNLSSQCNLTAQIEQKRGYGV